MQTKLAYFELHHQLFNPVENVSEVSGIALEDRAKVIQDALFIYPQLLEWSKEFPVWAVDGPVNRFPAACLAAAAVCLGVNTPTSILLETTALALVLFLMDDVTDGAIGDPPNDEQLEALLSLFTMVAEEKPSKAVGRSTNGLPLPELALATKVGLTRLDETGKPQPWIQAAAALVKICQRIREFPASNHYYPFFVKGLRLYMEANRIELHWRQAYQQYVQTGQTFKIPTLAEFLTVARGSSGISAATGGLLAMLAPTQAQTQNGKTVSELRNTKQAALLDEVALLGGTVFRLADDIRSYKREKTEGKLNALLVLRLNHPGLSEAEAETRVLIELDHHLTALDTLVAEQVPAAFKEWGQAVSRLAHFSRDWFLTREFHHFSLDMLTGLALYA
jgi:hypothetical protein